MQETSPSNGKGVPNHFYCRPTDDKGGQCDARDCDGRASCLLQHRRQQRTKDGPQVKRQEHFRSMIGCGYCGQRRHNEDECHIKCCESKKHKKTEEEKRKQGGRGNPDCGGRNPGRSLGKGNPGGGRRSSAPLARGRGQPDLDPTRNTRASSLLRSELNPPQPLYERPRQEQNCQQGQGELALQVLDEGGAASEVH